MSEGPYRPDPDPQDAEAADALARLAAQGQRQIRAANAAGSKRPSAEQVAARNRDYRLRVALGAYYGVPVRRACLAALGIGVLALAIGGGEAVAALVVIGAVLAIGGFVAVLLVDPTASRARLAAEQAWAGALPFALDGYFELLGDDVVIACRLRVELTWAPGPTATLDVVRDALGVWDPKVAVVTGDADAVVVRGSPFKCGRQRFTNGRLYGDPVPNRQLVARIHRLVEDVLVPVHRSRELARVWIRSEPAAAEDVER